MGPFVWEIQDWCDDKIDFSMVAGKYDLKLPETEVSGSFHNFLLKKSIESLSPVGLELTAILVMVKDGLCRFTPWDNFTKNCHNSVLEELTFSPCPLLFLSLI